MNDIWVLKFDGRIPTYQYYFSREKGVKARDKYRNKGFHVRLTKLTQAQEMPVVKRTKTNDRNNVNFFTKLADRFRRRNR